MGGAAPREGGGGRGRGGAQLVEGGERPQHALGREQAWGGRREGEERQRRERQERRVECAERVELPRRPRDWDAVKRSLLLVEADADADAEDCDAHVEAELAATAELTLAGSSQPASPGPTDTADPPLPVHTYPGTATPVQYFLSGTAYPSDVVPPAARDLLRRMASPAPVGRPSAAEVVDELRRLASEEGVEVDW